MINNRTAAIHGFRVNVKLSIRHKWTKSSAGRAAQADQHEAPYLLESKVLGTTEASNTTVFFQQKPGGM